MEFQFFAFNFIPIFLFLSVVFIFINKWRKSKEFNAKQKLPPGPWKLPFIGSLHHLTGSLPHYVLRDLARKHGPLMHLKLGEVSTFVISSPRLAKEVMRNQDLAFANRPESQVFKIVCYDNTDIASCPYGEYWREMRKLCVVELFTAKSVRSFGPIRQDEGSRLIASVQTSAGKPINLSEKVKLYTSSMVSRTAFGKVCKDQKTFIGLVKEVLHLAGGFDIADLFPSSKILQALCGSKSSLLKIHYKVDMIFDDMINEHVKNRETTKMGNGEFGEEDIVDILLGIKESGSLPFPFTNKNIKAILFDVFGAGAETSTATVEWAMSELMRNPKVMVKAQREIREAFKGKKTIDEIDIQGLTYLKLVIKETLRLHPPAPLLSRECRDDCKLEGYDVPIKTNVLINIWAIARDEDYWPDPESFIPERFENSPIDFAGTYYEYTPFGSGRRICPGITFGLANVELVLALLLYHFNWKLPNGLNFEDLDMSESVGIAALRKISLYLVPTWYDPSLDTSC